MMKCSYHPVLDLAKIHFGCLVSLVIGISSSANLSGESRYPKEEVVSAEEGQDEAPDLRVDLVVVLDEQKINQLRQSGGLQVKLPKSYQNGINSLVIKQEKSFLDRPMVLPDDAERLGEKVLCKIDQSILSHLPYQPIRIRIYHSDFDTVLIGFQPEERILLNQLALDSSQDSGIVWANLKDGRSLPGHIRNGKAIKFSSQLGEVPIPWEKITRVEMQGDSTKESVMVLVNGDRLQGQIHVDQFVFLTRWGTQTFDSSELGSITRSAPSGKSDDQTSTQSK